ncbi:hypothetical protein LBMAG52_34560 [Planctomycetia bacterium]|nr:hypothetical protein LBMAG52_34560 [Planctomycetia bacterium]
MNIHKKTTTWRALIGTESDDGFEFDFAHDRIMLATKIRSRFQGGRRYNLQQRIADVEVGRRLSLNDATSAAGSLRVEIQDAAWKNPNDVSRLAGQEV